MCFEIALLYETLITNKTSEGPLSSVYPLMSFEGIDLSKLFMALNTGVRFDAGVDDFVSLKIARKIECLLLIEFWEGKNSMSMS